MDNTMEKHTRKDSVDLNEVHDDASARVEKRVQVVAKTANQQCHFYNLPRELRDMVYDRLWAATPLLGKKHREFFAFCSNLPCLSVVHDSADSGDDSCLIYDKLPRWLLIDKTILSEGMEKLRATAIWDLVLCSDSNTKVFDNQGLLKPSLAQAFRIRAEACDPSDIEAVFKVLRKIDKPRELDIEFDSWFLADGFFVTGSNDGNFHADSFTALVHDFPELQSVVIRMMDMNRYYPQRELLRAGFLPKVVKAIQEAMGPVLSAKMKQWIYFDENDNERVKLTFQRK
jgi:hypothetical protein